MKIYISGSITNDKNADVKFSKAEKHLQTVYPHAIIYNPINIPYPKLDQDEWFGVDGLWKYYMHESVKLMMECTAIYLLSDWQDSKGATIEKELAEKLGMVIIHELKAIQ
jgi:hypothetical protein